MNSIPALILAVAAAAALRADPAQPSARELLRPGIPEEIYVAPGRATTVLLHTGRKIAAISLASPIVSYKYDKSLNQLEITPTVRSPGVETNLNLRIGPSVYVLLVRVVGDVRAQFLRDFALEDDPAADDENALGQSRPLKPSDIDLVGAAQTLERAETDPVFRQARPALRIETLDRLYLWNDCLVSLNAVAQFLDLDLLVFRVRWINRTQDALYLDSRQYGLLAGSTRIPITARYEAGPGPIILPGQVETVYLAVQGYRLGRHNPWELALPPEASALSRAARP
ncbi:MAG: hypothetical protein ABSA05_07945 [Opitutaceae bacterium]|jgi:hypothetical protein